MGIAAWVWVYDSAHDDAPAHQHVVFSPDGRSTATVEVTEQVGRGFPSAVFVSADAVFAGYSVPRTEPAAEPTMGLLVGTPAG